MPVSNADILGWLNENPGADDTLIATTMREAGVTPEQMAQATGLNYGDVTQRYQTALAPTYTNTDEQGSPIYANVAPPVVNAPSALPTVAAPANTGADTGALAQATTNNTSAMSPDAARALVEARYATIGRTGVGTGANQIDEAGLNAWTNALVSGEFKPEDLNTRFGTAVTDYMAQNPNDQYTNYVKGYLADKSGNAATGALVTGADNTATANNTATNGALTTVANNTANTATAGNAGALTQAATGSTTANTAATITNGYLKSNPDVAAAYATYGAGMTQDEFAQSHYASSGAEEGRKSPFLESSAFANAIDLKNGTYLASNGDIVNSEGTKVNSTGSAATSKLVSQILGQGTTSKWSGQGHGTAEANAADMAKILAGIGITDITQFGKVTKYEPVQELYKTYNGQQVITQTDEEGKTVNYVRQPTGEYEYDWESGENRPVLKTVFVPPDAKLGSVYGQYDGYETVTPVDPSKVTIKDGKAVVAAGETFGNTVTGQAVPNTYSERQTGNAFGGTFAGSGNTGYRVDFSQGAPVFYTTGASSNDLVNLFADNPLLGAVANVAAGYFGGPAGVAALQAAMGKGIEDIAKGAVLAYVGGQIAGNISGSTELINSVGADAANVIGRSVGKYVSSEGKADIVQSLAGGAVDYGVNQITSLIPDFGNLSQGVQDFTKTVVATTIKNGGDLSMNDLVDAAFTAGTAATKAAVTGTIATAIAADKTINDAVTAEINNQTTIDASGAMDINAAAKFAEDSGYNKFTFDGKTYTLDNNNAANTIAQLESDALATNTAANLKGGEFDGVDAQVAATAKANNTNIGNAEADNLEEAAYLARQRNPTGTTFTFDGKTYTLGASNTAVTQALNETQKTAVLDEIKNAKTFNEAFATARAGLGAGQTFTWNGKEYSTATAAERPDLSTTSIDALNKANLATTTNASSTVAAQSDTAARNAGLEATAAQQAAQKTAIASMEKTGVFDTMVNAVQNQMKLSSAAANDYLKNNPNSPITNSVSTAYEAAGNLEKNVAGGIALLTNNKPLADAFVKSGNDLTKVGQSIGNGVVDTKNWNETTSLIQNAKGWEKIGILAGRIMDGNSGLGRQVEVELRQELPGLFLGGGSVKGILVATGAMDVGETTGNAALETYDESIKAGTTHACAPAP